MKSCNAVKFTTRIRISRILDLHEGFKTTFFSTPSWKKVAESPEIEPAVGGLVLMVSIKVLDNLPPSV